MPETRGYIGDLADLWLKAVSRTFAQRGMAKCDDSQMYHSAGVDGASAAKRVFECHDET